jgi:hypothetical protein
VAIQFVLSRDVPNEQNREGFVGHMAEELDAKWMDARKLQYHTDSVGRMVVVKDVLLKYVCDLGIIILRTCATNTFKILFIDSR